MKREEREKFNYLNRLKDIDETGIEKMEEIVNDVDEVVFAGKGRSGYAAKIGEEYLAGIGKNVSFYNDPSSPLVSDFKDEEIALLCVSGSGETEEVVQAAKDYKSMGGTIISITADPKSRMGKLSDAVVKVFRRRGEKRGSYLKRQIVRPESPTMGDESEEMSLLTLYLLAKKLQNPDLNVKKNAEREIEQLKSILKEDKKSYIDIRNTLDSYRNAGIYFIGMGKSERVCKMVSNRAQHYGFIVYSAGNSTNPPIKFHNLAMLISGSGSAGGLLSKIIKRVKEERIRTGKQTNRSAIAVIVGRKGGIEEKGDTSLYLKGGRPAGTPTIEGEGEPEPFYFRAPVTFNMMLREIAEERGITRKIARERHVNW